MKVPWRLALVGAVVSGVLIEILDDHLGLRNARFVVWPLVILPLVWIASREWTRSEMLERWARTRGLEADSSALPDVERYLQRQRRFTFLGGLMGMSFAWGYDRFTTPHSFDLAVGLSLVIPVSALLLVAQMLAERTFTPEAQGTVRRAELVPRRLTDYISRGIVVLLRVLGVSTIVIALSSLFFEVSGPDATLLITIGIATGVFVSAVELSQHWRTRWPRPFESTEAAHLQDVLRADAIRVAIWGGVVAGSAALAAQLIVLGRQIDDVAGWALPLLGATVMALSAIGAYRSNLRGYSLARRKAVGSG